MSTIIYTVHFPAYFEIICNGKMTAELQTFSTIRKTTQKQGVQYALEIKEFSVYYADFSG